MNDFKGGFRTHLQRTHAEWLKRRRACAYDVETGKIAPKSITIECINHAYEDVLVQFGDGDMMLSEFCRNHVTDIDGRKQPNGYDPVPPDARKE
jgi:hypothetical protein